MWYAIFFYTLNYRESNWEASRIVVPETFNSRWESLCLNSTKHGRFMLNLRLSSTVGWCFKGGCGQPTGCIGTVCQTRGCVLFVIKCKSLLLIYLCSALMAKKSGTPLQILGMSLAWLLPLLPSLASGPRYGSCTRIKCLGLRQLLPFMLFGTYGKSAIGEFLSPRLLHLC
jgi:hypothetical protein